MIAIGDRVLLRVRRGVPRRLPGGVGSSAAVDRLATDVLAIAPRSEPALILGETGAGKELVAQAIHRSSPRSAGPFVAVNCAALPDTLAESELFGHVKGAFSGASAARSGLFRRAHGGTLFLDEVGELSPALQAKLLRALELGVVRPVGSDTDIPIDTRILAATHRSLEQRVEEGAFREDLLARLDGLRVEVPPLRERLPDVPLLFAHHLLLAAGSPERAPWLLRQATTSAPPVPLAYVLELMQYTWPRNVRELQKVALAVVTRGAVAGRFVAPPLPAAKASPPEPPERASALEVSGASSPELAAPVQADAATLRRLLEEHNHVQHRVAKALGVPYATLDRWLRREGILRPRDLDEATLRAALSGTATLPEAARRLGVSERGLRLRMAELDLPEPDPRRPR
jgi:transcriptional regulator with GAF, ATPase, and Fis domain